MALNLVTFEDKQNLSTNESIARINKITDDDMNELKDVANSNANNIGDLEQLNTTDKSSLVNAINDIVEVVENTNGTAIKFGNGIMICYGIKTFSNMSFTEDYWQFCNRSSNEFMYSDFPVPFIEKPSCVVSAFGNGRWIIENADCNKNSTQSIALLSPKNRTDTANVTLKYQAIGRWK